MTDLATLAQKAVDYNNQCREAELLDEAYSADIESFEAGPMPDGSAGVKGLPALKGKWEWWEGAHEIHSSKAEGPFIHGEDRFGIIFEMDVTEKASGERSHM
ncbi:MAG: SnoaL-like domain-containing protein [Pseudomonadota bacterium]